MSYEDYSKGRDGYGSPDQSDWNSVADFNRGVSARQDAEAAAERARSNDEFSRKFVIIDTCTPVYGGGNSECEERTATEVYVKPETPEQKAGRDRVQRLLSEFEKKLTGAQKKNPEKAGYFGALAENIAYVKDHIHTVDDKGVHAHGLYESDLHGAEYVAEVQNMMNHAYRYPQQAPRRIFVVDRVGNVSSNLVFAADLVEKMFVAAEKNHDHYQAQKLIRTEEKKRFRKRVKGFAALCFSLAVGYPAYNYLQDKNNRDEVVAYLKENVVQSIVSSKWNLNRSKVYEAANGRGEVTAEMAKIVASKRKEATLVTVPDEANTSVSYLLPPASKMSSKYNVLSCFSGTWGWAEEPKTDIATFAVATESTFVSDSQIAHRVIPGKQDCEAILAKQATAQYGKVKVVVNPQ